MDKGRPAEVTRRPAAPERPTIRWFVLACGAAALAMGVLALAIGKPQDDVVVVTLQAALIPAAILALLAINRDGNRVLLAVTVGLLWVEAIITAALYTIGVSFAIVIPLIAVGVVQPYVRGRAVLVVYAGAAVVSTLAVLLFALGVPTNPLGAPLLAVLGFGFLSVFALGLVWRAGERWVEALDAADAELAGRVRAERDLRDTTSFLATLVDSSPVPTFAIEPDGTVSLWNPASERLFGCLAADVRGRPPPLAFHPEDDPGPRTTASGGRWTVVSSRANVRSSAAPTSPISSSPCTRPRATTRLVTRSAQSSRSPT